MSRARTRLGTFVVAAAVICCSTVAALTLSSTATPVASVATMLTAATTVTGSVTAPVESCSALAHADVTASSAALAQITSSSTITYNGASYCQVTGYIAPQDFFKVLLPMSTWTGSYLQEGCGGSCGSVSVTAPIMSQGCMSVTGNQFVLAADDMGHNGPGVTWAAVDVTMRTDFAYLSEHQLNLTARTLIQAYYGHGPQYAYFDGCSTGGRSGLMEAQRYPTDFNGILVGSPVLNLLPLVGMEHAWDILVNIGQDGKEILTSAQIPALHAAVMESCANSQGYIPDPRSCGFNPASIQCPAGQSSDNCLTPAQVKVVDQIYEGPVAPTGQLLYPGGEPYGSELEWPGTIVQPGSDTAWPYDTVDSAFVTGGLKYEYLTAPEPPSWRITDWKINLQNYRRLSQLFSLYNATDPNLSAFQHAGGKLIIWQPGADQLNPPMGTIQYYSKVVSAVGGYPASQTFSRFYLIPGGYHCEGGGIPQVNGNLLTPLVDWVQHGQAPGSVSFPVVNRAGSLPTAITVAPLDPNAPPPGGGKGLNDNYRRYVGDYSARQMWCSTSGMRTICRTTG